MSDVAGPATPVADRIEIAQRVRDACLRAAVDAHETAGLAGLCAEGRWEAAVDAMRSLDPVRIVAGGDPTGDL